MHWQARLLVAGLHLGPPAHRAGECRLCRLCRLLCSQLSPLTSPVLLLTSSRLLTSPPLTSRLASSPPPVSSPLACLLASSPAQAMATRSPAVLWSFAHAFDGDVDMGVATLKSEM